MAELRVALTVEPGRGYDAVAAKLRRAGPGLKPKLTQAIRREGATAVAAIKSALMGAKFPASPSRGTGASSGLRRRVANSVSVAVAGEGVRIRADGKKVDSKYGTSLLLGLDGLTKIRHPVFGNRRAWVSQRGGKELFYSTLRRYEPKWRDACEKVLDDMAREIG
jgi:hypothetical protein